MESTSVKTAENTRISGDAVYTPLSQLPERFQHGPHTKQMADYLSRRWSAHSYDWFRRSKGIEYNRPWTPENRKGERYRWIEHPSDGLRFVGKAHEINFQDETVCGEVYQMPSRDGQERYIPAVSDPNSDGAILSFPDATDDLLQAIRKADSMAEWYAEDEREYQAKDAAERRIEEIGEEIKTARETFKALAKELRANCDRISGMEELRKLVRREYRRMRVECRKLTAEKTKIETEGFCYY